MSTNVTEVMKSAVEAAERHSARLQRRDRQLVQASAASLRADADRAEPLLRRHVFEYPDETEAWFFLGEVLFHHNPWRGRSLRKASPAFERALAPGPHAREATGHLAYIAAMERDRVLFDSMATWMHGDNPQHRGVPLINTMRAVSWGDEQAQSRAIADASQLGDTRLLVLFWRVTMFTGDYEASRPIARLLLASSRAPEIRAFGHFSLADFDLAQGRWQAARGELSQARRLQPERTLQLHAFYAALPFVPVARGELLALRDSLRRSVPDSTVTPNDPPFPNGDVDSRPMLRLYLMALLSLRLGEVDAARRYAAELDELEGTDAERRYAYSLSQSIQARLLQLERRTAEALDTLEAGGLARSRGYTLAHFAAQGAERFLRAELLFALGRYQDALGWYSTLTELTMADLVFVGPVLLRQAEIQERLGNRQKAAEHYARFIELWKDCDPELRPMREEAERRLSALQGR